jgi:4-hydroxybenzoate polyprenyltransferase
MSEQLSKEETGHTSVNAAPVNRPLAVVVEGGLVRGDVLLESCLVAVRRAPVKLMGLVKWMARGRTAATYHLLKEIHLRPTALSYYEEPVEFVKKQVASGRKVVLVSSLPQNLVTAIAEHLQIKAPIIASSDENIVNVSDAQKLLELFSGNTFALLAPSRIALMMSSHLHEIYTVEPSQKLIYKKASLKLEGTEFKYKGSLIKMLIKEIRLYQSIKNILIFAPMLLAHKFGDMGLWLKTILAFIAFSMISSSVYLINDTLDLESDRLHPDKKNRPFASGRLSLTWAFTLTPFLMAAGWFLALSLSPAFAWVVTSYFIITLAYSFHFKQVVIADIIILACLYALRIFAGSIATSVDISNWFLTFCIFLFLSLALVKRASELIMMKDSGRTSNPRRGYWITDLDQLLHFGTTSGYISVLVLILYLNSDQVAGLYARPRALWLICPLFLYWISRVWIKAFRGKMHSDPLVFTIRDHVSYIMIASAAIIWLVASGII